MAAIETKEMKGVSIKTIITIIIATITISSTVIVGVNKLSGQNKDTNTRLDKLIDQQNYENKYNSLRMDIMEKSLENLQQSNYNLNNKTK